ncbi:MAG: toluene-4-monooxygenase system B family protein [Panacagrimonas sp.]
METLPLVCSFEDGCILTLVPVDVESTMDAVASTVAEHFAGRMLPLQPQLTMRVRKQGDTAYLPRDLRVRDAGWTALTTIQIGYERPATTATH